MKAVSDRQLWLQHQLEEMSLAMKLTGRPEARWLGVLADHARAIRVDIGNMETVERGLPPPRVENVRATLRVIERELA
jgi:hypothetical protein